MRTVFTLVSLILLMTGVAAQARELPGSSAVTLRPQMVVHDVVASVQVAGRATVLPTADPDLSLPARLALFAGTGATVSLLELGDRSPLKPTVPEALWPLLLARIPRLASQREALGADLLATLITQLEARDLALIRTLAGASGAALAGSAATDGKLQRGVLVFSAGTLLTLLRNPAAVRRLAVLSVKPGVPADIRKEAAALLVVGAALVVQQELALARFLASLDEPHL
ncbi:MAG: hypothetical protein HY815_31900 [Candidatus Riflebacteria bacterium]|nr:hypothetical protein [Candidatus Riflebacteria bacterium]